MQFIFFFILLIASIPYQNAQGSSTNEFKELFHKKSPSERQTLIKNISLKGGEILPKIDFLRKSPKVEFRLAWLEILKAIRSNSKVSLSGLKNLLNDDSEYVREQAIITMTSLSKKNAQTTSLLIKSLADKDSAVIEAAIDALSKIDETSKPAILKKLKYGNVMQLRVNALTALSRIHPIDDKTINEIIRQTRSQHQSLRLAAYRALADIGPAAKKAIPFLNKAMHTDRKLRWRIALTIRRVGGGSKESLYGLRVAANDNNPMARVIGADGLIKLNAVNPRDLVTVTKSLKSENAMVRRHAATVLGKMGPKAESTASAIRSVLDDPEPRVRLAASEALKKVTSPSALSSSDKTMIEDE